MVDFKEDERLNTLNHSCAHVMAQAVKHLYPNAKFWVGPVVKEGFYYDIDLGDTAVNDDVIAVGEALAVGVEKVNFLPGTELDVHDLHIRLGGCLDLFFH